MHLVVDCALFCYQKTKENVSKHLKKILAEFSGWELIDRYFFKAQIELPGVKCFIYYILQVAFLRLANPSTKQPIWPNPRREHRQILHACTSSYLKGGDLSATV